MCDVHLVPEIDEARVAAEDFRCGKCGESISVGEKYLYIEGALDDGSERRYRYRSHEICYSLSEMDVGDDGCFSYGGAEEI